MAGRGRHPLLAAAARTLSLVAVLPVRGEVRRDRVATLTALAPLGGLLIGLAGALLVFALRLGAETPNQQPSLLPATAGLALLALASRARHIAGLAAVADLLAAGSATARRPARGALADGASALDPGPGEGGTRPAGATGAVGTAAVLFVSLIQLFALGTAIQAHRGTVSLITACVASRLVVTIACAGRAPAGATAPAGPPADPSRARVVVAAVTWPRAAMATALACLIAVAAGFADYHGGGPTRAAHALIALVVATAVGAALHRALRRRVPGEREQVLGAAVEVAVAVALFLMAITAQGPLRF